MRTTLEIDDDLILAARQIANHSHTTIGRIVSDFVRKGMEPGTSAAVRNGVPLFPLIPGASKPSLELINRLRDEA